MSEAETTKGDGGLLSLVMRCTHAIMDGQRTVTISAVGKRPDGFPRGELLSVGTNGSRNYAVCPVKVLAWVHGRKKPAEVTETFHQPTETNEQRKG